MEHFGPGVELLDVSSDGEHVKFTCFTEKTVNGDGEFHSLLFPLPGLGLDADCS